MSSQNYFD